VPRRFLSYKLCVPRLLWITTVHAMPLSPLLQCIPRPSLRYYSAFHAPLSATTVHSTPLSPLLQCIPRPSLSYYSAFHAPLSATAVHSTPLSQLLQCIPRPSLSYMCMLCHSLCMECPSFSFCTIMRACHAPISATTMRATPSLCYSNAYLATLSATKMHYMSFFQLLQCVPSPSVNWNYPHPFINQNMDHAMLS
jgi:hypothetical protein